MGLRGTTSTDSCGTSPAVTKNNKTAQGAAQQAVVNGWTARVLLTLAQEGADPRSLDERPAAPLILLVIGPGVEMRRLTVREPT